MCPGFISIFFAKTILNKGRNKIKGKKTEYSKLYISTYLKVNLM